MLKKKMVCLSLLLLCIGIEACNSNQQQSKSGEPAQLSLNEKEQRWVTIFPIYTAVDRIIADPRDSNVIYSLASYGIFKRSIKENFWEPIWRQMPYWSVNAVAPKVVRRIVKFDPLNPNVIYITVSIYKQGTVYFPSENPMSRLLRSEDNGQSWEDITSVLPSESIILSFDFEPKSPTIMYVATSNGLFKTLNGGKSWAKISEAACYQIFLDKEIPGQIYAIASNRRLYCSKNGGASFNDITPSTENIIVHYCVYNPHDPNELFVVGQREERGSGLSMFDVYRTTTEIFKSTDKGQSWQKTSVRDYYGRYHDTSLVVKNLIFHPTKKDVIYTVEEAKDGFDKIGDIILKSTDSGKTWEQLRTPISDEIASIIKAQNDKHFEYLNDRHFEYLKISDIAVPLPDTIYIATNYGVYKTQDEGKTWQLDGFGLPQGKKMDLLCIFPHNDTICIGEKELFAEYPYEAYRGYWAGNEKNGATFIWKWNFGPNNFNINQIATAPDGTTCFAFRNIDCFYKSKSDGTGSELKLPFRLGYIFPAPSNPEIVYAVALNGGKRGYPSWYGELFKSEDGGLSWIKIDVNKQELLDAAKRKWLRNESPWWRPINLLAIDPQSPNTFYITIGNPDYNPVAILKTLDGGNSWLDLTDNLGFVPSSIAIDPFKPKVLYAHDLRSTDGGFTWKSIKPNVENLSVNDVAVHPLNPNIIYLATNKGIYKSSDSGKTWKLLNNGLLETDIQKIRTSKGMVIAVEKATGIYKLMQ